MAASKDKGSPPSAGTAGEAYSSDRALLTHLAEKAGEIGLTYFRARNEVRYKSGNSPVSEADDAIDDFLRNGFAEARPSYGWLSEETADTDARMEKRLEGSRVVIADPIDGTRGFIEGSEEWCISIAIVENDRPVHAILHCPALGRTFLASHGKGLELKGVPARPQKSTGKPRVTGSKKLISIIEALPGKPFECAPFIPSLAYRLALVAIGELDGAFARPGASEWDVAAADLILEEAGGQLSDTDSNPLRYNQSRVILPGLVAGHRQKHGEILSLAKQTGVIQ